MIYKTSSVIQKKFIKPVVKYFLVVCIIFFSLWGYNQITMYPYKVQRWVQPLESRIVLATAKHCSPMSSWLNVVVDQTIREGGYSVQAAFLDGNIIKETCEAGYKGYLLSDQVNASDRYRYASASKLITTALVLNLVKRGLLDYQDTMVSFFPELNRFKDKRILDVTIADLLNHRAGFNRLSLNGDPMFLRSQKPWCPHDLKQLQLLELAFNPGEKQVYSNLGYCLLGEVIHRVTGQHYRDYAEREFQLSKRNIKFIDRYYFDDEVRYDYRYEEWYSDSYLNLFDFDSISSVAGLSGSAFALTQLLWDIHHEEVGSPFILQSKSANCNLQMATGCLALGVFHYQPIKDGITLHFHEGYLPGVTSIAIVDSLGGVTVLIKSGANSQSSSNEWVSWVYKRLSLYYAIKGQLPILNVGKQNIGKLH